MKAANNKEIKILRNYFLKRQDVGLSFLFGSRPKGTAGKISDWDIGIYIKSKTFEWEEQKDYKEAEVIWAELIDILKTDAVDLVVLNKAPLNIVGEILKNSQPLVIRNEKLFFDLLLISAPFTQEYREFVDDYYNIYQHARSLSLEAKERLKKITIFIQEEISLYNYFKKFSYKDYSDVHKRHDIERWIENLINSAIDIGEIILASEKRKIPDYYREIFLELINIKGFNGIAPDKFSEWVRLRNILAHEYLDIKWLRIEKFIKESSHSFKDLLEAVKRFIAGG